MTATRFLTLQQAPVRHIGLICLGTLALCLPGCKPEPQIRTYTVGHRPRVEMVVQRMLGAIIPNDKEAWFFKLQGPDAAVSSIEPAFVNFTKAVKVADGKVTWTAPETWKERAGGEFRLTTFLVPVESGEPLELAVSRLDAPEGVNDQFLVMNLSRWLGQLGRDSINAAELPQFAAKIDINGGSAWLTNFTSPAMPATRAKPDRSMPADHPPISTAPPPVQSAESGQSESKIPFELPSGWRKGRESSMRQISLAAGTPEAPADISVFRFPADANELLPNVNRWRQQVGLKEVSAGELEKTAKKIAVGAVTGDYVELVGEKETILGAMVKKGEWAWFFKLQATKPVAESERGRFEEFVKSCKLPD